MKSYEDFEYDGLKLSSFGFILCKFESDGLQTVSNGAHISFNAISVQNGSKQEQTSIEYADCLETVYQICKNPCIHKDMEISQHELRTLSRWLNRTTNHKFKPLNEDFLDIYYEGHFNISQLVLDGKLVGLELEFQTNRPFALQEPIKRTIIAETENAEVKLTDFSDVEGYIYPELSIEIADDGDLSIYNALEERTTYIANCSKGEIITMNYPIIESSLAGHAIQNDFNWNFLRLSNTFKKDLNTLTISLPCTITLKYSPTIKVGL